MTTTRRTRVNVNRTLPGFPAPPANPFFSANALGIQQWIPPKHATAPPQFAPQAATRHTATAAPETKAERGTRLIRELRGLAAWQDQGGKLSPEQLDRIATLRHVLVNEYGLTKFRGRPAGRTVANSVQPQQELPVQRMLRLHQEYTKLSSQDQLHVPITLANRQRMNDLRRILTSEYHANLPNPDFFAAPPLSAAQVRMAQVANVVRHTGSAKDRRMEYYRTVARGQQATDAATRQQLQARANRLLDAITVHDGGFPQVKGASAYGNALNQAVEIREALGISPRKGLRLFSDAQLAAFHGESQREKAQLQRNERQHPIDTDTPDALRVFVQSGRAVKQGAKRTAKAVKEYYTWNAQDQADMNQVIAGINRSPNFAKDWQQLPTAQRQQRRRMMNTWFDAERAGADATARETRANVGIGGVEGTARGLTLGIWRPDWGGNKVATNAFEVATSIPTVLLGVGAERAGAHLTGRALAKYYARKVGEEAAEALMKGTLKDAALRKSLGILGHELAPKMLQTAGGALSANTVLQTVEALKDRDTAAEYGRRLVLSAPGSIAIGTLVPAAISKVGASKLIRYTKLKKMSVAGIEVAGEVGNNMNSFLADPHRKGMQGWKNAVAEGVRDGVYRLAALKRTTSTSQPRLEWDSTPTVRARYERITPQEPARVGDVVAWTTRSGTHYGIVDHITSRHGLRVRKDGVKNTVGLKPAEVYRVVFPALGQ